VWLHLRILLRIGGCTFAENPDHSCARVRPLWSAALDPHVLAARAQPALGLRARSFDAQTAGIRIIRSAQGEHLLVDRGSGPVRIDVSEGSVLSGPVNLQFDIRDDDHLAAQIAALRVFDGFTDNPAHRHLVRHLRALAALDARRAGGSLRETADLVIGPGDWPGDGEHRKSQVRRLVIAGEQLVAAGPGPILAAQ
jgi:hypothetical protein